MLAHTRTGGTMRGLHGLLLPTLAIALLRLCGGETILVNMLPGGVSHQMQGLAIARALHKRGHRTAALLADYDVQALEAKGILGSFVQPIVFATPPGSQQKLEALFEVYQKKPRDFIAATLRHYEEMCGHVLEDDGALRALRQLNATLALNDAGYVCGIVVADLLGLPRVEVSPIEIADPWWARYYGMPHSPAVHPFLSSGLAPPLTFLERAFNTLMTPLLVAVADPVGRASTTRLSDRFNLSSVPSAQRVHQESRLLLVNAAWGLSTPRSLPPRVKMVGPLLGGGEPKPLPHDLENIVQQSGPRGVVYASFGTVFRLASCDVAHGLAQALSSLGRTVVWSLDPAFLPAACPLGSLDLAPQVHALPWVPQADLLAHPAVKAFVTHAGANSFHEAAHRGVPVVCIPQGADQFDCCAKAVKVGWGVRFRWADLSPSTAHLLVAAIELVASDGAFTSKAASVSAALRAHPRPAVERAADWVEYAIALPPDVDLQDPAAAMPWWQWHCVDVYGALAALLLALAWAARLAARAAWRCVCGLRAWVAPARKKVE